MEEAIEELKRALRFKKRVVVPYLCTHCQDESTDWSGRCRRCGLWNTYVALPWVDPSGHEMHQMHRDSATAESRPIPYQGIASPFETV
jgi:predicted ATP-dependent serine protease